MGSERTPLSVVQDRELHQCQTPTDQPEAPHLDTLRSKRLQFFRKYESIQKSAFGTSESTAPHADRLNDRPVSLCDGLVSQGTPAGVAELNRMLLRDSDVPEHQKLRHVLAWAQNFIRTGSSVPPAMVHGHVSPTNADHVTHTESSNVTLTDRKKLPTEQILQYPQINFSNQSCPLSQPCHEPRRLSQLCPEPHPLPQTSSEPRPLSQPCPEPHPVPQTSSEPRPLSQPCPEPHPVPQTSSEPRPLSQPCPEPHPLIQPCPEPLPLTQPSFEPRSCTVSQPCQQLQPGFSVYETYLMCVARLSCRETQGHEEVQLICRETQGHEEVQLNCRETQGHKEVQLNCRETQGHKEAQLNCRETQGREEVQLNCRETQSCKEAQRSCRETQGHEEVQLICRETQSCKEVQLNCRETQGCRPALVRESVGRVQSLCVDTSENRCTNLTRVVEDINSSNCERGEGRKALASCTHLPLSGLEGMLPNTTMAVIAPAVHTTAELPTNSPTDYTITELTANMPADHTITELTANMPADHTIAELTANTPADHTTADLPTNTPADHRTAELAPPAAAPESETCSGVQDCCLRSSDAGRSRAVAGKKAAGSWPRQAVGSGSSRRRRFWEKSSMLWSSYPEGTLLPRMKPSNRPAAASSSLADCTPQDAGLSPRSSPLRDCACPGTPERHVPGGTVFKQWLSLPDELWLAILKLMSHSDLCHVAQTCHRLCRLANDRTLWQVVRIENSTCLNADWLKSIGRRGPCCLTLYRCTDKRVTSRGLEELFSHSGSSLKELRIVSCSGPGLHGDKLLLPCSRYCAHLTNVDVSWTGATDIGIAALASATSSLESLVINGCHITDRVFKMIIRRHGASLRRLEIFGCRSLSAQCLSVMATDCPSLKVVNLGKLPKITEACLTFITSRLKQLTSLDLTGLAVVQDRTVHQISWQCPDLQDLTLRGCPSITNRSLIEICTYSASIRYLDVRGCSAVTDLAIQAISMACQRLQYLDLSSTKTSNKGIRHLASYGSRCLHTVKISFCYICQDSLRKLCRYHQGLRLLHLYGACDFHNVRELQLISPSLEAKCDLTCVTRPGQPH